MKIQKIYTALSVLILFNMIYGPLVRATDSGLACPDWPLCNGQFVPTWTFHIFMEVGHRYYSGILGILIFAALIFVLKNKEHRKNYAIPATLSLIFLISQVTLGALTVTKLLHPTTVNLHLINAVLLLTTCLTIALQAKEEGKSVFHAKPEARLLFVLILAFVLYQLFLGGKVSSHYAGLACPDFPTCFGEWIPKMHGTIRFQMEHRIFGYITALLILGTTAYSIFRLEDTKVKFYLKAASYLIILQILVGALNVLYQLPKLLTGFHTLNGVFVFTACYIASFHQFRKSETGSEKVDYHA
ncbi:cytochrome oxidase assembly protein [Leptospira kobayashii]|uniref:Cytochrome oxidase assembly protein n=1 Tax=Leptospira kobayashii TaxID=1917830 RepID=A0ABM7ULS4_9LEPT|nr:heme A synthase [Leptospira kobayashii]BDA79947.1 cytochrome oxidase assembly protein [Leptospira kobayashii]